MIKFAAEMKRIISLVLLSVYFAFVAGTLFSATEDASFIYHSSEFKGKYHSSSDDGLSYLAEQANAKKIQKHLPFNGKIKLTRPGSSTDLSNLTSASRDNASRNSRALCISPDFSSVSLYLKNRILLI